MHKKIFKSLIISILITVAAFIILGFPQIKNFGITALVKEAPVNFDKSIDFNKPILKGQKITAKFQSSENNLGIVLIRFIKFGTGKDTLVFRLKKDGEKNWYYENKYFGDLFQNGSYFPFGFPRLISSKNVSYIIELESIGGTDENGIGLSNIEPQDVFVYNYSARELLNLPILSMFVAKKLLYVSQYINYFQLFMIFVLSMLFFYFQKEIKDSIKNFRRNPQKEYQRLVKTIVLTRFYQIFLNTGFKKRFVIGLVIFISAFLYRFAAVFTIQQNLFYATLGGQGDYDQFMRASTCALHFCSWFLHQNLLIESLILGSFYHFFGFINGLKAYSYLMLITSSIVATFPYLILSRKNWLSIGGIIGSMFFVTADFLTLTALNFPPDNGSVFIFSLFYIFYLMTMQYGTIRWLFIFGLAGFFDGMFKAMFLINDLVVLALFVPIFFYEKTKKITEPFGKQFTTIFKRKNIKILYLSLLPLLIFLLLYSAWEYIVQIKYSAPYFLRGLIDSGGSDFRVETLFFNRASGHAEQNLLLQIFYILISGFVMIKRIISLAGFQIIFLAPICLGLLIYSKFKIKTYSNVLNITAFFSLVIIVLLILIKNNYLGIHQYFPGEYIYKNWTLETYINIFLFVEIIFLFIINFKYQAFKLSLPIFPYIIMLVILSRNAPWERLLVHIIVWCIILFAFLIDWILTVDNKKIKLKNLWIGLLFLVIFLIFYTVPKISNATGKLWEGYKNYNNEVNYLKWVNSELPDKAVILGGGSDNLVTLGDYISKPIIYNSYFTAAVMIPANRNYHKVTVAATDFSLIGQLRQEKSFKLNKYIILEEDIIDWRKRIAGTGDGILFSTSSAALLDPQKYEISVFKVNPNLKKGIYELKILPENQ